MTAPTCPDCGTALPADSPRSLCPACLMRQALASRTVVEGGPQGPAVPPPSPEEIAGKFPQFEILECLGRGGMGVVYKARQKSLNRLVAIKILAPEREHDARFAERFAREAELLAKLNHPHIVTIHDFGETGGLFYLAMEFVDGVNLRDLLRDGKLAPEQALAIVPPVCEALQYAHGKGIVHRDIKPENLLLDRDGRIKIADFGIAMMMDADGGAAGTPPYMAPEQSDRRRGVDHRADIYALGVVLYEMLTGERPAKELVAPSKRVRLDARLDEMVLRAMDQDPGRRYQTAEDFRTVVETLAPPAPPPFPEPPPEPARRGPSARLWWLFLVMIPLGTLLGTGTGGLFAYLMPKKYEATTVLQFRPVVKPGVSADAEMATWMAVVKARESLEAVATRLQLGKRWNIPDADVVRQLKTFVDTHPIRGTSLIEVRVRYNDPKDVSAIANTLAEVVIERSRSIGPDAAIVHEMAMVPQVPVSPNVPLLLVIGAGAGLVLSPVAAALLILLLGNGWKRAGIILLVLALSFLLLALAVAFVWWNAKPTPALRAAGPPAASTPPAAASSTAAVTLEVQGAVARPGAYTLRAGATLLDALAAAGGWTDKAKLDEVFIHGAGNGTKHDLRKILDGRAPVPALADGHNVFVARRKP